MNPHLAIPNLLLEQAQAELNIPALPPAQHLKARLEAISGPKQDAPLDDEYPEFGMEPELEGKTVDEIFASLEKNYGI